jgi:hypothetical protein
LGVDFAGFALLGVFYFATSAGFELTLAFYGFFSEDF